MIKLDVRDAKAVATNRFYRVRKWYLITGWFAAIVIAGLLAYNLKNAWLAMLPMVLAFASLIWDGREATKYEKAFLEKWDKEGVN